MSEPRTKIQVHDGVEQVIRKVLRNSGDGAVKKKFLDAPCGEGAFLERLRALGVEAYGLDIEARPEENIQGWNLNQFPLPYPAEFFHGIASIEGIEHLENPFALIREFWRLLKPSGYLILTTPNILSIRSRVRSRIS